jgi:sulfate adenylyltransferase subunit 2
LTAGIKSRANTLFLVIDEILKERNSERSGRLIDSDKLNSMELKKREGYF